MFSARLTKYVGASSLVLGSVVSHAFLTREQFFPAMQYLSSSKIAIAVAGNFAFAAALVLYKLLVQVFLGQLRDAEVERINDRISQAIMETCLAMTIFREEFNVEFCTMFTVLTFIKVFHWLVTDRVEYLETTPSGSRLQHLRIVLFMALLLMVDAAFLQFTVGKTLQRSASVHLLFAFEYVIQASVILSTMAKYALSCVDAALEGRWEGKGTYTFYLELITDMLHLFVYLIFFVIVFANYGLPLHLVRDLYWTFRNFRNRVADFLRYRRVTANMDERFPDASPEELERADHTCIVCREDMTAAGRNKKLPCGHVFHLHCLRSWLERQQNCPICRTSVFAARPRASPPPAARAQQPAADDGEAQADGDDAPGQRQGEPEEGGRPVRYWRVRQGVARVVPIHPAQAAEAAAQAHRDFHQQQFQRQQAQAYGEYQQAIQRQMAAAAAGQPPASAGSAPQHAPASPRQGQQHGHPPPGVPPPGFGGWPGYMPANSFGYPMPWNVPQWYPNTSMALFAPAGYHPLQFAGQQGPGDAAPQLPRFSQMLPVLPMALPPALQAMIPPPPPGASPQQIQNHRAAAAAAAAAAASVMSPYGHPLMVPPTLVMPGQRSEGQSSAGSSGSSGGTSRGGAAAGSASAFIGGGVSPEAAAAAANAAAAAAAAAVISAPSSAGMSVEQLRRRQVDILQAQLQALGPLHPASSAAASGTNGACAGGSANATLTSPSFPPSRSASAGLAGGSAAVRAASDAMSAVAAALGENSGEGFDASAPASLASALQTLRRADSRASDLSVNGGASSLAAASPSATASPARTEPSQSRNISPSPLEDGVRSASPAQPSLPPAQAEGSGSGAACVADAQLLPDGAHSGETAEQAELRRRRLQRFGSQEQP